MNEEKLIFGASATAATMFMLTSMDIRTPLDIVLWLAGGIGLLLIPSMVFRMYKKRMVKPDGVV